VIGVPFWNMQNGGARKEAGLIILRKPEMK
jgi:hypothetical protein